MKKLVKHALASALLVGLSLPLGAYAADQDLQQKIDALSRELENLKQQVNATDKKVEKVEEKSLGRWLTVGGDYRFRYDYLNGKIPAYNQVFFDQFGNPGIAPTGNQTARNNGLYTNRFGLDLKAKATENVTVTARLLMYKVAGNQDDVALRGDGGQVFFADRAGIFDGTVGHVPGDNRLAVDRVYGTWNNIMDQPLWFSIGRRPSTGGVPSHLKQNNERPGNSGVPQLLVDYAFDGVTIGYAPDIEPLPGFYTKFCYGRGFSDSIQVDSGNSIHNTDMIGVNLVPYETDAFRAEFQYNRGMNIFDSPAMLTGPFAGARPSTDLGDFDWFGADFLGAIKNVGPGKLNWFVSGAMSLSHPNGKMSPMGAGLLFDAAHPGDSKSQAGYAVYLGGRYDIEQTGTKLGFEYNYGSKFWQTFAPAADDMWTAKVGARGNVYEGYIIQELKLKPISSYLAKTFFRVGYQYYDFNYTGSNNWAGSPVKISDLGSPQNAQFLTPLKSAQDLYVTFEVKF